MQDLVTKLFRLLGIGNGSSGASADVPPAQPVTSNPAPPQANGSQAPLAPAVEALRTFAFDLYRELPGEANLCYSPLSIAAALAMLKVGARSTTAAELAARLGLPEDAQASAKLARVLFDALGHAEGDRSLFDDGSGTERSVTAELYALSIANGLFAQLGFEFDQAFTASLRDDFDAHIQSLDFEQSDAAAETVNYWVEDATNGKIRNLISPDQLDAATVCVLVNAVHFLADWTNPFAKDETIPEPFHRLDEAGGGTVDVPMMRQVLDLGWMSDQSAGYAAVTIPYEGAHALVILPDAGRFRAVEAALDAAFINRIDNSLESRPVALWLPRFTTHTSLRLRAPLAAAGLPETLGGAPDLAGISDDPRGFVVSDVVHQARIEVDEKGTEAAAATAIVVLLGGAPRARPPPIPFRVDRPFFLVLRDNRHRVPLFVARVVEPDEG